MPLGNFATILPFLSPSYSPIPNISRAPAPPPKEEKEKPPKQEKEKKPTLRICFPLKIQRGASSWWEYEEFRIEFRDRLMWRQAFGLDCDRKVARDSQEMTRTCSSFYSNFGRGSGERLGSLAGGNGTFYDDFDSDADDDDDESEGEDRGMKSRWSFSSYSSLSSAREDSVEEDVEAGSSGRFMYLIPRLLFLTKLNGNSTQERSSSVRTSTRVSSEQQQQQQKQLKPAPLKLESKRQIRLEGGDDAPARPPPPPSPPIGTPSPAAVPAPTTEAAEIQHHRTMTLQKLEGSYICKARERYLSTFRSLFRTPKSSPAPKATLPVLPHLPAVAPLRLNSSPGIFDMAYYEWDRLRDEILGGLSWVAESLFPPLSEGQTATFMRVKQEEGRFTVEQGSLEDDDDDDAVGGVKEALERIEERNWEDVLFIGYEDTPKMRRWYTTREPQILEWGEDMI